ncbi:MULTISPECIES: RNase adapter RapZ [Eubacteriales]|uniref:RNase adapter RapZ n=1 Tax=Eubacteriales TaxID=186802 RepID=UPI00067EC32E|nr:MULTISPECIES: RNase adapter RapZ [Eubacteriales]MBS5506870.1 RNase adapter RapZ [Oscillospiraceae bacterium]MCB5927493.1 RNase adapter RapZ [bacterium 210820-DFI.5.26]MEE0112367.1 RNase adapter RapZ [Eubacteriales bacterium]MCQ5159771.1 RNase adapter RapZ [Clostridium sp. DFI.5.61]UMM47993.1 RNase adapter RapZ [Lawsonibacter asaccharolyticus]
MEFIIISGLSGAGKSKAASFMEDMGFFCVDNLPAPLIPKFAELGMAGTGEYDRVVLVTDVRSGTNFSALFQSLEALKGMKCPYRILYMDASDDVIIKRYKETRRSHPLAEECDSLEGAIALERRMLAPLRERAEFVVDTSDLSTAKLRGELLRLFGRGSQEGAMTVSVTSFGFKHGLPREADLVFDVRFLPNPYYVQELRPRTGLDDGVRDYVFSGGAAGEFLEKLQDLVGFLLPKYVEEGKTALVVAVGCTGGHHRSVAIAHALAAYIRGRGYPVTESHRDLGRT